MTDAPPVPTAAKPLRHGELRLTKPERELLRKRGGVLVVRCLTTQNTMRDGSPWSPKSEIKWDAMLWREAWIDDGPSPAGNAGPYLHVPFDPDGWDTVHRVYPWFKPPRLWPGWKISIEREELFWLGGDEEHVTDAWACALTLTLRPKQ